MNELQIKITADVKDIQSALTKVKKTLKEFEDSMSSGSNVANGSLERQKGIIEQLNAKINSYKTSITRALSEQDIAKYNAKLQETQKDLARLNALGKVFQETSVQVQEQTGLIGQLNAKLKQLKSSLQEATTEKEVERLNIKLAETGKELTRITSLGKGFKTTNVEVQEQNGLIGKLNSQLKQLKVSLQQATSEKEVARLNSELSQTSAELARINSLGKNISAPAVKSFNKFRVSAGAAGGSAIAFNRIIQDAPFGIIGVGNNIQQFAEQLTALKATTGSTGAALKTFFVSLISPANLVVLAVSAITAAFTAYRLGVFDSKEETKDLISETEQFNQSLNNVVKSLNAVDSARLQGNKSAANELVELELLNSVLSDTSNSESERLRAYNTLLEKYPRIIKNISDEQKLVEGLGKTYNLLVNAIVERAKAVAVEDKIVELAKERLDLLQKEQNETRFQNDLIKQRTDLEKQQADALAKINAPETKNTERQQALRDFSDTQAALKKLAEENTLFGTITEKTNNALIKNDASVNNLKEAYKSLDFQLIELLDPVDSVKEASEGLNRVFDENILFLQRFGNEADKNKKKVDGLFESLEQEQKSLFGTIASLKQEPASLINIEQLAIAQQRLTEIDALIGSIASKRVETEIPSVDLATVEGFEGPDPNAVNLAGDLPFSISELEAQIAGLEKLKAVTNDTRQLALYNEQIANLKNQLNGLSETKDKTQETVDAIVNAFSTLGAGIAASLNIGDRALRGFVTTLLSATPKIISAIISQAAANKAAATTVNIANAQQAGGNAIVSATEGAKALGPVGLALLPVFIAGAVALVSSAFSKIGSGGSGASVPSGGSGSTFTNRREFGGPVSKGRAYIVGEKRPELFVPNTNGIIIPKVPSMDYSGASMSAGAMAIDVNIQGVSYGDDILFTVQQAQIRRGVR
jgi:DNA repair exonuclease SbcCD ATPase subunit